MCTDMHLVTWITLLNMFTTDYLSSLPYVLELFCKKNHLLQLKKCNLKYAHCFEQKHSM